MSKQVNYLSMPFSKVSRDEIKQGIVKKYGNLARFCKIAELDNYELHKILRAKPTPENNKEIRAIFIQAKELKNICIAGELCDDLRDKLVEAMKAKHGYITNFCKKYPTFSNVWISKVFHGDIRKVTAKVKKFADKLGVKIER